MSSQDYIYCYQGKALRIAGGTAVLGKNYDKYNPLDLPYYTMRLKFAEGYTPNVGTFFNTLVDADENIWDCAGGTGGRPQFPVLMNDTYLLECISANMRTADGFYTSLQNRFNGCTNLVSVSLPCTDHITTMREAFKYCSSLTSVPLLDTSSCTEMRMAFLDCENVQSGALALYQQASSQATPPNHGNTFTNCGSNTVTGAAELAQIPRSWGGTMAE